MKKPVNTFWSVLWIARESIRSISILWRISRGQLWLADMILRLFLAFVFFIDMSVFQMPILVFIVLLAVLIKTIFLMVQRLNDLDFSWNRIYWALGLIIFCLIFQHIITWILLIIFLVAFQIALYAIPGTVWTNQFGPDPLKKQPKENDKYFIIVWILLFLLIFFWAITWFFLGGLEALWIWWGD